MALITWDTVNKGPNVTLSNGNLQAEVPNSNNTVKASIGKSSGKWYWELSFVNLQNAIVGVISNNAGINRTYDSTYHRGIDSYDGRKYDSGVFSSYAASFSSSAIIGILLDMDNGAVEFRINNISYGIASSNLKNLGTVYPSVTSGSSGTGCTVLANFGDSPFVYEIPSGYSPYHKTQKFLFQVGNNIYKYIPESNTNIVPAMTSSITPSGQVFASSFYGANYEPYRAFDRNSSFVWDGSNVAPPYSIGYQFTTPKVIKKYTLKGTNINNSPQAWELQGSHDGTNYSILHAVASAGWASSGETKNYTFTNNTAFLYYRLYITAPSAYPQIDQIEFIEEKEAEWQIADSAPITKNLFDEHGMDSLVHLERKLSTLNIAMNDGGATGQVLGAGKVFKERIDLTKFIDIRELNIK